jgi:hypothetical protein
MNSHWRQAPALHELAEPFDDVRLRRDRIGADDVGPAERDRFRDGVRAFSLLEHRRPRRVRGGRRRTLRSRGDVAVGDLAAELVADRVRDGVERDDGGERGEAAEQHRVRQRPAEVLQRDLGRRHRQQPLLAKAPRDLGDAELVEAAPAVDEHVAVAPESLKDVDLVQQRRVLDDQHVRGDDRLAQADLAVVDAAERDDRCAGALRAEARERLRVATLREGGDREELGGGDDALAAAAVKPDLQHRDCLRGRQLFSWLPAKRRERSQCAPCAKSTVAGLRHSCIAAPNRVDACQPHSQGRRRRCRAHRRKAAAGIIGPSRAGFAGPSGFFRRRPP